MLYLQFCVQLGIPITTTNAGQRFSSLIFHDDIKCITAIGQTMIYIGVDYMLCNVIIIHFVLKILGSLCLQVSSYDQKKGTPIWLHCSDILYYLELWLFLYKCQVFFSGQGKAHCNKIKRTVQCIAHNQLLSEFIASITQCKRNMNLLLINACLVQWLG